ncbi:MAG: IS66 family insertion sequence element accessory protein TnpB [Prevotellaceae bacterium]|nr:IS66 family insertion sequence element accessory protein TnpB [Prevotellaceae bacterium]
MFSLGEGTKFWLYTKPTDMRKNFNILSGIVNVHMGHNLYSGDVFVYVNSANNMINTSQAVWSSTTSVSTTGVCIWWSVSRMETRV